MTMAKITSNTISTSDERKRGALAQLHDAAARLVAKEEPWAKYNIPSIPAERIVRHLFDPVTRKWYTDETIVKIEKEPFTHGAMRFCYRMKKLAQPPKSSTNHRFHKLGWSRASNYLAKAYQKDGVIDTSEEAKKAVQNDIMLQYEAQLWASKFNEGMPPRKIHFIRAYAIEFPDREGKPWMAVERFIEGTDMYGAGFVKHNTNSGFVDTDLRRVTPQVFSAHSFYCSEGQRLVADIQGVGDLYTDPQVLSNDYRFGDGDLGPRGMALFFKTFRHCAVSDSLGIPIFPLSRNELKVQAKYEEDEITMSDEESLNSGGDAAKLDNFQRMDLNRLRRRLALKSPRDLLGPSESDTMRVSNVSRADVSQTFRRSLRMTPQKSMHRTRSDVGEVERCLERAKNNYEFTHRNFHRGQSGELRERHHKEGDGPKSDRKKIIERHASIIVRTVSAPILPTNETIKNLGKVHYQMAVLHGSERFPDVVPEPDGDDPENLASHDAFSVLFHLSHAASLQNAPACLAIARVHAGLETKVSELLEPIVSTDFEAAKHLLRRAMTSPQQPTKPKAAAGCLLYQFLHDEASLEIDGSSSATVIMQVIEDTLELIEQAEKEANDVKLHESRLERGRGFHKGDAVEADYAMEGTYYSAIVVEVSEDEMITVKWDDDGSEETFSKEHVRPLIPPTAAQTTVSGPLSDEEAFGSENGDDKFLLSVYVLKAELAELKEKAGDFATASRLYEEAADGAMNAGQMKNATKWSLKAAELQE